MPKHRRTPAVSEQVVSPIKASNALLKKRLIDFDTNSATLEQKHKDWLAKSMQIAKMNSGSAGFTIHLYAYASKLGNAEYNYFLSLRRMNAVLSFMQTKDQRAYTSSEWWCFGEDESDGEEDSPNWRAVEVHIFINTPAPTQPRKGQKVTPRLKPLPGGKRFKKWDIASPGGSSISNKGISAGFNIFFIRNHETKEVRRYIQANRGFAGSIGTFNVKIKSTLEALKVNEKDFKSVESRFPATWSEMEQCVVRVSTAGATLVIIRPSFATITFTSPSIYHYDAYGNHVKKEEVLFQFTTTGIKWQLGNSIDASISSGLLFRI